MIISRLQGGLGNQMFQWAYGRSLEIKYGKKLYLETSSYSNTFRSYSMNNFPNVSSEIFTSISIRCTEILDSHFYKDIHIDLKSNYILNGYWQSEKYFIEIEDIIRKELSPSDDVLERLRNTPLINTNTVSIHIRRTDYVTSDGFHPVQSFQYYESAIKDIGDYDYLFVFSDDMQWCKDNLKFNNIIFMEGFSDIEDIWLMSLCKHNIIANSSFSWWGAWLNNNTDKKVVAPNNWFGEQANLNSEDIIPKKWIKI
jgi:hypothetical protein